MVKNRGFRHQKVSSLTHGFTLVELLLAMALFSFMLSILSLGFLQIGRIYQSGVASRSTQQTSRAIMEDISREVRGASTILVPVDSSTDNELCLQTNSQIVRYQRTTDDSLVKAVYSGDCSGNIPAGATKTVLVDPTSANNRGLRAQRFVTKPIKDAANANASVEINLIVSTSQENDLLNANGSCKEGVTGSQFCSSTSLTNTVSIRGVNND